MKSWKNRKLYEVVQRLNEGDVLLVPELSRLGRSLKDILDVLNELSDKQVKVYSVKENFQLNGDDIQSKVPVLYHVCGDNSVIDKEGRDMLKLVSHTNAAILDLDYQIDLKLAKEKIGTNNCIRGNTNTQVLGCTTYSISDVINEVEKTIEFGKS